MNMKTVICMIFGAFVLANCANTGHYPVTGQPVGENDAVKVMSKPDMMNF